MNSVNLIGNIATDIESRKATNGNANCTFRLAVQRKFKNASGEYDADFINIVCWRQTAEYVSKYCCKGKKISVEGNIQTRYYDAQDGSKRYVTEVVADSIEILTPKEKDGSTIAKAQTVFGTPVSEEDLPFE